MLLVLLVKVVPAVVLLVLRREPTEMMVTVSVSVTVTTDTGKIMIENVSSVTTNVFLVKPSKTTVSNVTETEKDLTIVDAQPKPTTTVLQSVQTVMKNVLPVLICQTTVPIVPQEESTHQLVVSQNQLPNLLKLKISQWLPPELSNVLADVVLVNMLELTVRLVVKEELMLLSVPVLMDTSKTLTVPVKNVHTNVKCVLISEIVQIVKIMVEEFHHLVIVLTDISMPVLLYVTHVPSNVLLVLNTLTVSLVNHPEKTIFHIVTALMVPSQMIKEFAEIVTTNVKIVI
jgi:hypothetical protein